jgi:hypothetical protein
MEDESISLCFSRDVWMQASDWDVRGHMLTFSAAAKFGSHLLQKGIRYYCGDPIFREVCLQHQH